MIALFNMGKKGPLYNCVLIIFVLLSCLFLSHSYADAKEYYKWKDDKGTTHVTDEKDRVPEEYRSGTKTYGNDYGSAIGERAEIIITYVGDHKLSVSMSLVILILMLLIYMLLFSSSQYLVIYFNRLRRYSDERLSGNIGEIRTDRGELRTLVRCYLENKGYVVSDEHNTYGMFDFIVRKGRREIAVSVNNNLNPISKKYLSDLYNESTRLGIKETAVYTTGQFETDARDYAKRMNCSLYDKNFMAKIFINSEVSHNQNL